MVHKCKKCGKIFKRKIKINEKFVDLGSGRAHCLDCYPYKSTKPKKRKCNKCGEQFPPTVILSHGRRLVLTSRKYCLKCSPYKTRKFCGPKGKLEEITNNKTQYSRDKRRELKILGVKYLGGSCIKCGYNKTYSALTFHHRNPKEKEFQISGQIRSWKKIKIELDKCDLLCSNCHIELENKS